jgi:hypothetical protein
MRLATLCAVLLSLASPHHVPSQHETTRTSSKKPAVQALLPPRVFGHVEDALCVAHRPGQFGFYNGQAPGRHDPYADIVEVCGGYRGLAAPDLSRLESMLACGPMPDGLVVCGSSNPPFGASRQVLLFAMRLHGPVPLQFPADRTGRFSLFIDAAGATSTKSQATAAAPDVSSQGTNLIYQVVFNDPGTSGMDIGLLALDRRKDRYIQTTARAWIHRDIVTFVVPGLEIGPIKGVRGGTFFGSRAEQGAAALGEQEVAPGGVHHPFGLLAYTKTLF